MAIRKPKSKPSKELPPLSAAAFASKVRWEAAVKRASIGEGPVAPLTLDDFRELPARAAAKWLKMPLKEMEKWTESGELTLLHRGKKFSESYFVIAFMKEFLFLCSDHSPEARQRILTYRHDNPPPRGPRVPKPAADGPQPLKATQKRRRPQHETFEIIRANPTLSIEQLAELCGVKPTTIEQYRAIIARKDKQSKS